MAYKVSLNYPQEKNKQRKLWLTNISIYILLGIMNLFYKKIHYIGWVYIILGLVSIVFILLAGKVTGEEYFIELTENYLKYKRYKKKLLTIPWSLIEKIEEKPTEFLIYLKDSKVETIELEAVNYKEVREIKQKLEEFAKKQNIVLI